MSNEAKSHIDPEEWQAAEQDVRIRLEAELADARRTIEAGDAQIAALQQAVADTARQGKTEADALRAQRDAAVEAFGGFVEAARHFDMEFSVDEARIEAEEALTKAQAALFRVRS